MKRIVHNNEQLNRPPKLYLPHKHHSVSDWDHSAGAFFTLDNSQYISAPRSLRIGGPGCSSLVDIFLCRLANTLNLPQGKLVSYYRSQTNFYSMLFQFRNQSTLGTATRVNTYQVMVSNTDWILHKIIAGEETEIGRRTLTSNPDTWYHDRLTWWNSITPEAEEAIAVMLERYIAGEWVQQGDWLYDTANLWKNSEINRCGIGSVESPTTYNWHDDTEIWGPS